MATSASREGSDVKGQCRAVGCGMDDPDSALRTRGRQPVGPACRHRWEGGSHAEGDQATACRSRLATAHEVEQRRAHPRAEREVSEKGMERMTEPVAAEEGPCARRDGMLHGALQRNDGRVDAMVFLDR